MGQAGAQKLRLSRSEGKGSKHHTLGFFYILCAVGNFFFFFYKKVNFDLVNQKRARHN